MNKTCCPTGKTFDITSGQCTDLNHLNPTDPIECPCCPIGTTYDSITGMCIALNGEYSTTIPCPCCPDGYSYRNISLPPGFLNGYCQNDLRASDIIPTIPCLDCNCVEPTPRVCAECGTDGLPVTFDYNPNIKNCIDCEPHDITNPPGKIQSFLPEQFLDPITSTFVLRNKNFI